MTINEQKYTEENMNPPGVGDVAEAFKAPAVRLLVAANKFQTGFDQPLLHTMYVDKKLGGVAAVQTLSRLNRTMPGIKLDTMVLDFVNDQETIQASFQDYYQRTELAGATDPDKLNNLKYSLEQTHVFTAEDVAEFVELFVGKKVEIGEAATVLPTHYRHRLREPRRRTPGDGGLREVEGARPRTGSARKWPATSGNTVSSARS